MVAVLGDFALPAFDRTTLAGPEVWNSFLHRFWMSIQQPKFVRWLHAHHLPALSICSLAGTNHPLSWEAF